MTVITTAEPPVRVSRAGPATGLIAQLLLLAVLAGTAGLGAPGWLVGVACAVTIAIALERGLARRPGDRLGPASSVTLARATLAVGVAALAADSLTSAAPVALVVTLASVALALDLVDGWLARRTGTVTALGARFDGEVDAFLILALSVYVAPELGAWVLGIGAARYVFFAGERLLWWMRAPLPPRRWRKLVAAAQGTVLTVAATGVMPRALMQAALAIALALLVASVGECVWWLWRRRHGPPDGDAGRLERGPLRTGISVGVTGLAVLVVWVALVAPDHPSHLTLGAFARLPLELLVVVPLAVLLPAVPRRLLAVIVGAALGVLVLVRVLDIGFLTAFDRPFDPVDDWSYAGAGIDTLRDAIGTARANLVVAVTVVLAVALLVLPVLALLRVTRVAAGHRDWALRAAAALAVVWVALRVAGAPVASTSATALAVREVQAVEAGLRDREIFTRELARDAFRATGAERPLAGLRGKDVLLVYIESYGKVAVHGSSVAPRIAGVLERGAADLQAAGFSARSAFLTSPTFGGLSWLAHATLQSGVWIDGQRRYDQLHRSDRITVSRMFKRAGWRAIGVMPWNAYPWREGRVFYRFDKIYNRHNMGYRGPGFGLPPMPDQYALAVLQRRELARRHRRPLFAEVNLTSTHAPWTRLPVLIPWRDVGDGSIYHRLPMHRVERTVLYSDPDRVRAAFARSIKYTLSAVLSFVRRYGDDNTVLVVLGDHQPATIVTGQGASHDVPISVIARDPSVLDQIAGWGWQDGLRPGAEAPVWPMSAFRDRFLAAFGSAPASVSRSGIGTRARSAAAPHRRSAASRRASRAGRRSTGSGRR